MARERNQREKSERERVMEESARRPSPLDGILIAWRRVRVTATEREQQGRGTRDQRIEDRLEQYSTQSVVQFAK